jgi:hypothetical protein
MKKIFLIIALFLTFSCSKNYHEVLQEEVTPLAQTKAAQEFVQGSQDIPLATNLEKTIDEAVDFDSNSGSIISSSYKNKSSKDEVKEFYAKTLPDMGWQQIKNLENKLIFKREKEQLEIEFNLEKKQSIVTFFISSTL